MRPRFYVTTPIYYASDVPHLGHAYTTVVGDAFARFHRLAGEDVRYLTGTDDHGQKIERVAAARGKDEKAYTDEIAEAYRACWAHLGIAYDDFIRTTDPDHEAVVQELWAVWEKSGDVYLGDYEGWYCVACEQYYTEKEITDGKCPVHARPVEKLKEQCFFFRLSAYQKRLQAFYDEVLARTGRHFVEPQIRMNEVRAFVDAGLNDFAASRTNFKWGIPVPGHPGHVVYVWLDALTNYYSATRRAKSGGFWDAGVPIVHLMGKEITRFHAVYWPAMLMSGGLRLPDKIIAHGWWTVDGAKMSKTAGNVVDPVKLAADIGADAFRYFVLREVPLGSDGDFSHEGLITRYNAELANDLGNLVNRTLGMVWKYFPDGVIAASGGTPVVSVAGEKGTVETHMREYAPSKALEAIWTAVRVANTYIDHSAPWKGTPEQRTEILSNTLESCRMIGHWIQPFMPEKAAALLAQLGISEAPQLPVWRPQRPEFRVAKAEPLFPRIDEDRKRELLARWAPKPEGAPASETPAAAAAPVSAKPLVAYEDFARLDLRVGVIVAAERVPKKDKLLKLSVDLGSEKRQVVAGIATTYAPEALLGRRVIFVANLKPAKIGGVLSEGMILAAGEGEVLALSALDRECPPGTLVR